VVLNEEVSLRFLRWGDEEDLPGLLQRVFEGWPLIAASCRSARSSSRIWAWGTPHSEIDFLAGPKAAVHFQLGDTDLV